MVCNSHLLLSAKFASSYKFKVRPVEKSKILSAIHYLTQIILVADEVLYLP